MEETAKRTNPAKKRKGRSNKKQIVLWSILGVLTLALLGTGILAWHVLKRPDVFFETSVRVIVTPTPEPTPVFNIEAYLPAAEPDATPIPTLPARNAAETPSTEPAEEKEQETKRNIVNIALFGIDAFESGKSTSGSMPHTDANLVLAVDFDTKEVSLISIARDCLTTAPGHTGFYKFNGIFNVGGGMNDPKAGFDLSRRAAEEWLGGVSIPYYYGVDFQALIDLVDMIGGIDFELDIDIHTFDGRKYSKGMRHLDGYGVMAYVRMRKTADGHDTSRTARQRKMLIAIFKKLKQEGKLSMVPDLLKTMGNNVYTNTTLAQTVSLINFAKDIDPDKIRTYSIQGAIHMHYDWAFCFIDQQARIDMLKEVFGITASPIGVNSLVYEKHLHDYGFRALQYLNITKQIFSGVHSVSKADTMTEAQKEAYAVCWRDYLNLRQIYEYVDSMVQEHYDNSFSGEETKLYNESVMLMQKLENKLRASADAMNAAFGKPVKAYWSRNLSDWYGKSNRINDVYVDFR